MKGFFLDDNGNKSMTRLLVFIAAVTACFMSLGVLCAKFYLLATNTPESYIHFDMTGLITIISSLLAYAGLKKVYQKKEEIKK